MDLRHWRPPTKNKELQSWHLRQARLSTASTAEINLLDGVTASTAEINYLDGVTSNIQTQINGITTDVVSDTSPQLGGQLDTNGNSIAFGNWTIEVDGSNNLLFKYSSDTKIRMTAAGAFDVEGDIIAL